MRADSRQRARVPVVVVAAAVGVLLAACGSTSPHGAGPSSPAVPGGRTEGSADATTPATARPIPVRPSPPRASPRQIEMRGVWVHLFDDTLKSPSGVELMLDEVAAAGFNTVIVEVVRRQDAYYESAVLPRTTDPALAPGFDVLEATVAGARERGLSVHAWFPAMPAHHPAYADLPAPEGWVWTAHGPDAPVEDRWVTRTRDGRWLDYLDPGHPAVQDHVVAVAAELASRYDVDAVHVDYLRYPEAEAGYHPAALERFRRETGRTDVPYANDPEWADWRRAQTTGIVRRIHEAVERASPDTAVSAAVIAWGSGPGSTGSFAATRSYQEVLQDWETWIVDGLVDVAMPMAYFDASENAGFYRGWVDYLAGLPPTAVVAVGVGAWLNDPTASMGQIHLALEHSDGVVVYSYQQTSADGARAVLLERLRDGPFAEPASPPITAGG